MVSGPGCLCPSPHTPPRRHRLYHVAPPSLTHVLARAGLLRKTQRWLALAPGTWHLACGRHLGDLWPKTNLKCYHGNYSSPTQHGFDDWMLTQAEASNSMPNCGCFPVNHSNPGPKPPSG